MSDFSSYLTSAIALLAVAIAWAQWYTARSRLVLDLFNQRVDVYEAVRRCVETVLALGRADKTTFIELADAMTKARLLFGKDVEDYLEGLHHSIFGVDAAEREMDATLSNDDRQRIYARRTAHWEVVKRFYEDFSPLIDRYARMDHKRPLWRLKKAHRWLAAAAERQASRRH